ncbi:MAG: hypothetical protein ACYDCL_00145 [Myxococcales bacterium]
MARRAPPTPRLERGPVSLKICDAPAALEAARAPLAQGLRYAAELSKLWDPREADPERFVTQGILAVALAKLSDRRLVGWGELLVARPGPYDPPELRQPGRGFCRVSRLDVAPAYRRRAFVDSATSLPLSDLLLRALLRAAPSGTEVLAEVTPDAENLFESAGFKLLDAGRWRYSR